MLKDPLIRRFISGSLFAGAFIWVAIAHFNVEAEVVLVLAQLSLGFVAILIVAGFVLAPLFRLAFRRKSFLADLEDDPEAREDQSSE